jgi:hydrogenase large subunit
MAASLTLESAFGMVPTDNGRVVRNLLLGADFIMSHVTHFYHLAALDYINTAGILDMPPWQGGYVTGDMLTGSIAKTLVDHYVQALTIRRQAHQLGAIFGGRLPCPPAFGPGGAFAYVTDSKISDFRTLLGQITPFITGTYINDVEALAAAFPAYSQIGRGSGNLLAYGVFDLNASGTSKLLSRGRYTDGQLATVDTTKITEYVKYSYYKASTTNRPPTNGSTVPQYGKAGAYSWIKAPRYLQKVHEVGPLARMWVNGDYTRGISVLDRLRARALEAKKIALAMSDWVSQLQPSQSVQNIGTIPAAATGLGLTEAPRGALGHWLKIASSKVSGYQIVTPTAWNASPMDDLGQGGAIEQALIGTPVADTANPIELLRVVHSFDPCLACSVHLLRPNGKREPVLAAC